MDIFKLGDKILALLEAVFGFWNNQISLVFAMLGQSPVSFKGGGPWAVIEGIEPVFVAVGSSLVVLFFVIGFCSEKELAAAMPEMEVLGADANQQEALFLINGLSRNSRLPEWCPGQWSVQSKSETVLHSRFRLSAQTQSL